MAKQTLVASSSMRNTSHADSLALIQIFLNASLACIAHARELVPWKSPCFSTRYIDQIELDAPVKGHTLYSSFQAFAPLKVGEGQEVKVLVHGGHRRAEQILEMLEGGVFQALDRGYLAGFQVFVTKPSKDQFALVENYHFVITYHNGRVSTIQTSPSHSTLTLDKFHKSFKASTRALLRSLKDLPRLPARCKFGMSLTYNQSCPTLYQPPGFVDEDEFEEGNARAISDQLLTGTEDIVGILETGQCQVRVAVQLLHAENQGSSFDVEDTGISEQLQAMQKTSSNHSNNLLSTLKDSTPAIKRRRDVPTASNKRIKACTPTEPSEHDAATYLATTKTLASSQSITNSSVVEVEYMDPGQESAEIDAFPANSTKELETCLIPSKLAELLVHCYAVQAEKTRAGQAAVFHTDMLAEGKIQRITRSDDINCECGSHHSSRLMLYCEVCDTRQHRKCYGYKEDWAPPDPIDKHFCYTCLFFSELRKPGFSPLSVILLRKAADYLISHVEAGSRIPQDFLQSRLKVPRWTKDVVNHVKETLVDQCLLRRYGPLFEVLPLSDAQLRDIETRCTGPRASIGHFYENADVSGDPSKRTAELLRCLEEYARGQDYTIGQVCQRVVSYDEFGDSVFRWGYHAVNVDEQLACVDHTTPATPVHRRKISISRNLVSIESSPSIARMSDTEETSLHSRSGVAYDRDCSTVASTVTAD